MQTVIIARLLTYYILLILKYLYEVGITITKKEKKVNVGITYLKSTLEYKNSDISKSLSQLINNSFKARENQSTNQDPCNIDIIINSDAIEIADNSMGIKKEIDSDKLFTIEVDKKDMSSGIGMKRAFFTLGNHMEIISNSRDNSRSFLIYPNNEQTNLIYTSDYLEYDTNQEEGTKINITDLHKNIKKKIRGIDFYNTLIRELGYIHRYIIHNKLLQISIKYEKNNRSFNVEPMNIDGECIDSIKILKGIKCELYKTNDDSNGIEVFEKGIMKYDKAEGKDAINLKKRSEQGHSYKKALVVIHTEHDNIENIIKDNIDIIQNKIDEMMTKNRHHYESNETNILFSKPWNEVENLKSYYNLRTNKEVGEKGYEKILNEYRIDRNR